MIKGILKLLVQENQLYACKPVHHELEDAYARVQYTLFDMASFTHQM